MLRRHRDRNLQKQTELPVILFGLLSIAVLINAITFTAAMGAKATRNLAGKSPAPFIAKAKLQPALFDTPTLTSALASLGVLTVVNGPGTLTTSNVGIGAAAGNPGMGEPGRFFINGSDNPDVTGCFGAATEAAVAVDDDVALAALNANWTPASHFTGGFVNGDAVLATLNSSGGPLNTVAGLEGLVSDIEALPGAQVMSDCSSFPDGFGSDVAPAITVITGDCNISGNPAIPGGGVLVVQGQLNFSNHPFNGLVLVIGAGQFVQQSAKSSSLAGGMLIAQTRDLATGNVLDALGSPYFSWHSGSSSAENPAIQFDSCRVSQAANLISPPPSPIMARLRF